MAIVSGSLEATLQAFKNKTLDTANKIYTSSIADVADIAVDRSPVLTGRLKANWRASVLASAYQTPDWMTFDPTGERTKSDLRAFILGQTIYQTIYIVNPIPYAYPIEFLNHSRKAPGGMLRVAQAQWPHIVDANTRRFSGRFKIQGGKPV